MKKTIYFIIVLIVIQFIPFGKEHTNPKIINEPNWNNIKTKKLFYKACGDCHSYKTKWPSYSNYAPASWLISYDVNEGREHLNINEKFSRKDIEEAIEEIEENEMPPLPYKIMHKNEQLTDNEKKELINGLKETFLNEASNK